MNKIGYFLLSVLIVFASCKDKPKVTDLATKPDTSITPANAYNQLFLDSNAINAFLATDKVSDSFDNRFESFYNARNFQYAWFAPEGPAEQTLSFWSILKNYVGYSGDSSIYDKKIDTQLENMINGDSIILTNTKELQQAELGLTKTFFRYATRAYSGRRDFDMKSLEWFIPRKKIDPSALLDSLVANKGQNVERYAPVHPQYNLLRDKLQAYKTIEDKGGWPVIETAKKTLKKGDSGPEIIALKKRLNLASDSSADFNDSLASAIRMAQRQFGYKEDGIASATLIKDLNVPVQSRIKQLLINMERMRWVPSQPEGNYILVNIPEYRLHVYENAKRVWDMDIVVGKEGNTTTIFTGDLKTIVFSPYWNIPSSIVKKEILPGIKRNKNYIRSHNMEITGTNGGLPVVRQKPGGQNSLGKVKFLFPNNFAIYFHDSPAKSLFNLDKRSFSHGCIRLKEPFKMAKYLLRDDPKWTDEKIQEAMDKKEEKFVALKDPVPVFISYFTAWVDGNGQINFRDDLYGHDEKMAEKMFVAGK